MAPKKSAFGPPDFRCCYASPHLVVLANTVLGLPLPDFPLAPHLSRPTHLGMFLLRCLLEMVDKADLKGDAISVWRVIVLLPADLFLCGDGSNCDGH